MQQHSLEAVEIGDSSQKGRILSTLPEWQRPPTGRVGKKLNLRSTIWQPERHSFVKHNWCPRRSCEIFGTGQDWTQPTINIASMINLSTMPNKCEYLGLILNSSHLLNPIFGMQHSSPRLIVVRKLSNNSVSMDCYCQWPTWTGFDCVYDSL